MSAKNEAKIINKALPLRQAGLLSLLAFGEERKVRTPQSSIAGNARRSPRRIGPVQQKASTVWL